MNGKSGGDWTRGCLFEGLCLRSGMRDISRSGGRYSRLSSIEAFRL
jgi:hypothetical protein